MAVIDGGVTGYAVAGELSRYEPRICVTERGEDVCSGTSKTNSAIIHARCDAIPGTRKAEFNMAGSTTVEQLSKDLGFSLKGNSSLVLYFTREKEPKLEELYERGVASGVPGIRLITGDETRSMEPSLTDEVTATIYAPSGGIICPFGLTVALAGSAYENGVEFRLLMEVERIEKMESGGHGLTIRHEGTTKAVAAYYVTNAAGVHVDTFHSIVSSRPIHIMPGKGDYCLLDKKASDHVTSAIFQLPGIHGKDVLVTPAMHGSLLIGPTATDIGDGENVATTVEGLAEAISKSAWSVKNAPYRQVITSLADLRVHEDRNDFMIGEAEGAEGFYDAAGIESPRLSCAPTIGVYLVELVTDAVAAGKKRQFIACRERIPRLDSMEKEERAKLIKKCPDHRTIICRCESVGEDEIIDAIHHPLGTTSLDEIKRRVRQGIGRCQTSFCTPRTMEILIRELHVGMEDVCRNAPDPQMLTGVDEEEKR